MADISHTTVVPTALVSTDRVPLGRPSDGHVDGAGTAYTATTDQIKTYSVATPGGTAVWNDINISLVQPTSGAATPASVAFNGDSSVPGQLKVTAFSGTNATPDELPSSMEILHDYQEGTDIHVHVHWYAVDTNAGNVKWQLRYVWFNRGTVPSAATTVSVTTAASGVAWQEQTSVITISGTGKTMGSRFVFNLFRDATDIADTYASNAAVSDVGIHYQKDTRGSRQILIK